MKIFKVTEHKKQYLDLLLMADEQEDMVDRYLERGELFALDDGGVKAECVITKEADAVYELKNIAVVPDARRRGYAKALIDYVWGQYPDGRVLLVGTGDVPSALAFYRRCGFAESHRVKNFFTDNYDHVMIEDGIPLRDMVYLQKTR
ncbi:MAG: GNAT family N-acetyltransferase [Firmicutes bacterium]|nr:GNAT family N-acetyltransferase [Bacillota bacterium]